MSEQPITLADRITYAEAWLGRARRRLNDGEVAQGTLALVLAEAELHRAREAHRLGRVTARGGVPGRWIAWTAFGALSLAAAVVVASVALVRLAPAGDAGDMAAPVVRLSTRTGEMLRIATPPESFVEPSAAQPRVVHVRVPVRVPVPVVTAQPAVPAAGGAEASVPLRSVPIQANAAVQIAPPPAVAPDSAPPAAMSLLTDAEVIDMVLAAERSLRRTGNQ